jgi:hypothetical protein
MTSHIFPTLLMTCQHFSKLPLLSQCDALLAIYNYIYIFFTGENKFVSKLWNQVYNFIFCWIFPRFWFDSLVYFFTHNSLRPILVLLHFYHELNLISKFYFKHVIAFGLKVKWDISLRGIHILRIISLN